jgi:ribosomal protein L11 methyltransferase
MDYQKVTVKIAPDNQDFRDILMAELGNAGFDSFVENEMDVEAYIPSNVWDPDIMSGLPFADLFQVQWNDELIPDQNWNEVWEKNYFQPLLIEEQLLVRAPFHTDYPSAKYEIVIEPKMAFGTGNHETTSMMASYILEMDVTNKTILDMGCGTGILAMLSALKGATDITAIDIDEWAYQSTLENIAINNCPTIKAFKGDATLLGADHFDIIFANIHKNILLSDMEKYYSVMNEGGILLMSGFYENDLVYIIEKAKTLNLSYLSHKMNKKWVASAFQRISSK